MWNVIGIDKRTAGKIIIEPHMTEANAMKLCECWGWIYDDGVRTYWMTLEEEKEAR